MNDYRLWKKRCSNSVFCSVFFFWFDCNFVNCLARKKTKKLPYKNHGFFLFQQKKKSSVDLVSGEERKQDLLSDNSNSSNNKDFDQIKFRSKKKKNILRSYWDSEERKEKNLDSRKTQCEKKLKMDTKNNPEENFLCQTHKHKISNSCVILWWDYGCRCCYN